MVWTSSSSSSSAWMSCVLNTHIYLKIQPKIRMHFDNNDDTMLLAHTHTKWSDHVQRCTHATHKNTSIKYIFCLLFLLNLSLFVYVSSNGVPYCTDHQIAAKVDGVPFELGKSFTRQYFSVYCCCSSSYSSFFSPLRFFATQHFPLQFDSLM